MKIKCEYLPDNPIFSLGINIPVGSRYENDVPNGISHFLEHYIFRKSKRLSGKEIAKKFESLGAVVNAFTAKDQTSYYVTASTENFEPVAKLLLEIILTPDFTSDDIKKEILIIEEEINSYSDDFEEVIFEFAASTFYKTNPLSLPITGTIESIAKINAEQLHKFHSLHYQESNMLISLTGGISEKIVKSVFIDSQENNSQEVSSDLYSDNQTNIIKKQSAQGHILYFQAVENESETQRYALAILNLILGDGLSSRLYQSIREEKGLSYNIYSSLNRYIDITEISIYASFDEGKLEKIERKVDIELNKIASEAVTLDELSTAKSLIKTYLLIEDQSSISRMNSLGRDMVLGEEHKSTHEIIKEIKKIDLKEIIKVASKIFNANNFSKTIILPE